MSENKNETALAENNFLEILWQYFSLHASQRIHMLNFYIVLETFLLTAWLTLLQVDTGFSFPRIIIGLALILFSIVFYVLDVRTKSMIKLCEESLSRVEKNYIKQFGKKYMIFSLERENTAEERKKSKLKKWFLSYSKLLRVIYGFFALTGMLAVIMEFMGKR